MADAADAPSPAWQQFSKGYNERFVLDCVIPLACNGVEVRVAQAPSAKGAQPQQQKAATYKQPAGKQQQRAAQLAAAAAGARGGRGAQKRAQPVMAAAPDAKAASNLDKESDPALTGTTVWDG
jgi:hypothetical protein